MANKVITHAVTGSLTSSNTNTLPSPIKRRGGGFMRLGTRRARAACALCRWKKVRCDAEEGQPCSNCNFEDVQCVLIQKQRRRKATSPPKPYVPPPTTNESPEHTPVHFNGGKRHSISTTHDLRLPIIQAEHQHPNLPSSIDLTDSFSGFQDVASRPDQPDIDMDAASAQSMPPSVASPRESLTFSSIERSLAGPFIPSYLKSPPQHIGGDDIEYLHRKGALMVPDFELRDALIRAYIDFIHPTLPVVDTHAFLASLEDPIQHGQISLPLFQAVMFAGSAWVDIKLLRRLGFLTRKAARKSLYQKARLLYDSDYEEDGLCIVQTLVLLTLWWEGPNEQKDGWYWSGLSLHVSRTIGLTRDSTSQNMSTNMKKLRKRLWWSCLMRDTIASFGTRRPPRVEDSDFDVTMLTLDDFDVQEPELQNMKWTTAKTADQKRLLATICIEMVKLTRIMSRIFKAAYSEDPVGHIDTFYHNREFEDKALETPTRKRVDIQKLQLCEEELRRWREEIPDEALHAHPTPSPSEPSEQAPFLHRAILSLLYFTAMISLNRPQASQEANCSKIRYAASQCNEILMDLYRADLMRLIPATSISCLIPVAISHVHDMRSSSDMIRREGQRRLEECKQVLRELADAHIAAEWAINFLTFVESQIKRKAHKKLSGMMSGEIRWDMQSPQSASVSSPAFTYSFEGNPQDRNRNGHVAKPKNMGDGTIGTPTQAANISNEQTTKQISAPGQSPDDFSSMINFPEMWLDMAGASDSMLDMDWIEGNHTAANGE